MQTNKNVYRVYTKGYGYDQYSYIDISNDHVGCGWLKDSSTEFDQYIGKKDKNGVMIYENDIVSTGLGNYRVVFDYKELRYGLQNSEGGITSMTFYIDNPHKDLVIVGDYRKNPELINQ